MGDISEAIDMEEVMEIVDGDQELLKECFDEFQNSIPQALAEIQSSIEQGDASGLDESAPDGTVSPEGNKDDSGKLEADSG